MKNSITTLDRHHWTNLWGDCTCNSSHSYQSWMHTSVSLYLCDFHTCSSPHLLKVVLSISSAWAQELKWGWDKMKVGGGREGWAALWERGILGLITRDWGGEPLEGTFLFVVREKSGLSDSLSQFIDVSQLLIILITLYTNLNTLHTTIYTTDYGPVAFQDFCGPAHVLETVTGNIEGPQFASYSSFIWNHCSYHFV